ncbi:MAG: monovalent cation/H(+) antiporter subunit G [Candidatus Latescibacterota bacterium]
MSDTIGTVTLGIGILFNIFGCIGLIRFPDIYNRLQAATKCVTLGTCLVLAGSMILAGTMPTITKCLICMVFVLITSPTAAHALALGAHASGVKLWENSVIDKFEEDHEPGI